MAPKVPNQDRRDALLVALGDFIARSGAGPLLAPPVAPGDEAFPEPWRATRGGVRAVLRRLAWHAGNPRTIDIIDARMGAPPTERKPATRLAATAVRAKEISFRLEFLGEDDIAGTLAHELGVAHAVANRPGAADPYRTGDHSELVIENDDLERGSIATVYLGLGVLAANAAFQQYSRSGRYNGGYVPLEYDVLEAGHVPMSDLAYLLAVQAIVRDAAVPPGLSGPQRDEVIAWHTALDRPSTRDDLRERLGITADALAAAPASRPVVTVFTDLDLMEDAPAPRRNAFRWRTHRGGVGFLAGAALGVSVAAAIASPSATPLIIFGAAGGGHLVGRRVRVPRCTACATVVGAGDTVCRHCGAALRGDIANLNDRLEAEERLDDHHDPRAERPDDEPARPD